MSTNMSSPPWIHQQAAQAANWVRDFRQHLTESLLGIPVSRGNIAGRENVMYWFDRHNATWYRMTVEPVEFEEAKRHGAPYPFQKPYDR